VTVASARQLVRLNATSLYIFLLAVTVQQGLDCGACEVLRKAMVNWASLPAPWAAANGSAVYVAAGGVETERPTSL